MELEVTLHFKDDEEYYSVNSSDNRVEIDMLAREKKKAQSPTELLLSAVVACAAVDIVSMIKKRRKKLNDIKGTAKGIRREEHPRKFTSISVHYEIYSPDLTDEEADRIVKLAVENYCSVASTVNESTDLSHSFEIIR